jgi:DNA mismatch repair protein MutS2
MEGDCALRQGDSVKIRGQVQIGEIVRVKKTNATVATVAFTFVEVTVAVDRLEKVLPPVSNSTQPKTRLLNITDSAAAFNTEIDLHGMSIAQALAAVEKWVDKASLLGHNHLKVIHGKGTGALRHAVRTHLQAHTLVARVIDKHPLPGGEGVTWLAL